MNWRNVLLVPKRDQFRGWKFPSKIAYAGFVVTVVGLVFSIVISLVVSCSSEKAMRMATDDREEKHVEMMRQISCVATQLAAIPENISLSSSCTLQSLGDHYVYSVGISDYKTLPCLCFGEQDAVLVSDYFVQKRGYQIGQILLGPKCTKMGMRDLVLSILRDRAPEDKLVIFLSMWGVNIDIPGEESAAYLLPFDISINETNLIGNESAWFYTLQKNAYSIYSLLNVLDQSGSEDIVVIIDACRSFFSRVKHPDMRIEGTSRRVIAGPRDWLNSFEVVDIGHGALAHFLLTALGEYTNRCNSQSLGCRVASLAAEHFSPCQTNNNFRGVWFGAWNGTGESWIKAEVKRNGAVPIVGRIDSLRKNVLDLSEVLTSSLLFPCNVMASENQLFNHRVIVQKNYVTAGSNSPSLFPLAMAGKNVEVPPEYEMVIRALQKDSGRGLRRKEAIKFAEKKLKVNRNDAYAHWVLAEIYSSDSENQNKCREHAQIAIRMCPSLGKAYGVLGLYHLRHRNWEAALKYFDEMMNLLPDRSMAWHHRAYAIRLYAWAWDRNLPRELRLEMTRDAIVASKKALELSSDLVGTEKEYKGNIYFNRGRAYHRLGEFDHAISDYVEALKYKCSQVQRSDRKKYLDLARRKKVS